MRSSEQCSRVCRSLEFLLILFASRLLFLPPFALEAQRRQGIGLWALLAVSSLELRGGDDRSMAPVTASGGLTAANASQGIFATEKDEEGRYTLFEGDVHEAVQPSLLRLKEGESPSNDKTAPGGETLHYASTLTASQSGFEEGGAAKDEQGSKAKQKEGRGEVEAKEDEEEGQNGVTSLLEDRRKEEEKGEAEEEAKEGRRSTGEGRTKGNPPFVGDWEREGVSLVERQGRQTERLRSVAAEETRAAGRKTTAADSGETRNEAEHWTEAQREEEEEREKKVQMSYLQNKGEQGETHSPQLLSSGQAEVEEQTEKEGETEAQGAGTEATEGRRRRPDLQSSFIETDAEESAACRGEKFLFDSTKELTGRTTERAEREEAGEAEGEGGGTEEEQGAEGKGKKEQHGFSALQEKTQQQDGCNAERKRQRSTRPETSFLLHGATARLTTADTSIFKKLLFTGPRQAQPSPLGGEEKEEKGKASLEDKPLKAAAAIPPVPFPSNAFVPYIFLYSSCGPEEFHFRVTTAQLRLHVLRQLVRRVSETELPDEKQRQQTTAFLCAAAAAAVESYRFLRAAVEEALQNLDETGTDQPLSLWLAEKLRQAAKEEMKKHAEEFRLCAKTAQRVYNMLSKTDYRIASPVISPIAALGNLIEGAFLVEGEDIKRPVVISERRPPGEETRESFAPLSHFPSTAAPTVPTAPPFESYLETAETFTAPPAPPLPPSTPPSSPRPPRAPPSPSPPSPAAPPAAPPPPPLPPPAPATSPRPPSPPSRREPSPSPPPSPPGAVGPKKRSDAFNETPAPATPPPSPTPVTSLRPPSPPLPREPSPSPPPSPTGGERVKMRPLRSHEEAVASTAADAATELAKGVEGQKPGSPSAPGPSPLEMREFGPAGGAPGEEGAPGRPVVEAAFSPSEVNLPTSFLFSKCLRDKSKPTRRGWVATLYAVIHVMHVMMFRVRCTLQRGQKLTEAEATALAMATLLLPDETEAPIHFEFMKGLRLAQALGESTGFFGRDTDRDRVGDCHLQDERRQEWLQARHSVVAKGFVEALLSILT